MHFEIGYKSCVSEKAKMLRIFMETHIKVKWFFKKKQKCIKGIGNDIIVHPPSSGFLIMLFEQ